MRGGPLRGTDDLTRKPLRGPLPSVICDVCGRDNGDNLTFCQDCGRRLRQARGVAPTPPNGLPKVDISKALEPAGDRKPRPEAPAFQIPPPAPERAAVTPAPAAEKAGKAGAGGAGVCLDCGSANPPDYKFCVTCGAAIKALIPRKKGASEPPKAAPVAIPAPVPIPARPVAASPTKAATPVVPATPVPVPAAAKVAPIYAGAAAESAQQIVGAPVVDIAPGAAAPAKMVTCARCHGHSVAGTRFCKFCGAPLEDGGASRKAVPAPVERTPEPAPVAQRDSSPDPIRAAGRSDPEREPVGKVPLAPIAGVPKGAKASPVAAASAAQAAEPAPATVSPAQLARHAPVPSAPATPPPEPPPPAVVALSAEASSGTLPPGPARAAGRSGRLVVIVEDGSEGRAFSLAEGRLDVGRTEGDILLEDDPYVSPRHARLRRGENGWVVTDLDSTNRVYLRLRKSHPLRDGDLLLLGLEVLQFQAVSDGERGLGHAMQHGTLLFGSPATPRRARLCQRTVEGVTRDVYHLFRDETVVGRETGDIVFTADPFLSRRHAAIRRNPVTSDFSLVDLDSSNGTYVAIRGEVGISDGDFLRIGQHLFRVDLG